MYKRQFDNKLVVLLNDRPYHESGGEEVYPLSKLSHGCMPQTSGFSTSTRWLVVTGQERTESTLLDAEKRGEGKVTHKEFNSLSEYKHFVSSNVGPGKDFEASIYKCDILGTGALLGFYEKAASVLLWWLTTKEPLRQHQVYFSEDNGKFSVLHGYSRAFNSVVVVTNKGEDNSDVDATRGAPMCLAVAEAMGPELLIETFCKVVKDRKKYAPFVLEALKDAATTSFLWDVANYVKSHGEDERLVFYNAWISHPKMLELAQSHHGNPEIENDLQDLAARFGCISHTKDLVTWWFPWRRSKFALRKQLVSKVDVLVSVWCLAKNRPEVETKRLELKAKIKNHITAARGKILLGAHQRWRKSMMHFHSSSNEEKYGTTTTSSRLMEADGHKVHGEGEEVTKCTRRIRKPKNAVVDMDSGERRCVL